MHLLLTPKLEVHGACMLSCFSHVRLCNPRDCNPPGSSVHGILQARIWSGLQCPAAGGSWYPKYFFSCQWQGNSNHTSTFQASAYITSTKTHQKKQGTRPSPKVEDIYLTIGPWQRGGYIILIQASEELEPKIQLP